MGKKVIYVGSTKDNKALLKAIRDYEAQKLKQLEIYRQRLAEEIGKEAEMAFNASSVDDIVKGGTSHKADVSVNVSHSGNVSIIIANGEDAVWCEFGAGVYHNGSAGSSPNPYGSQHGMTIGSYGQGKGANKVWVYKGDDDEWVVTHGTAATMPMYRALLSVANRSIAIAREVFK